MVASDGPSAGRAPPDLLQHQAGQLRSQHRTLPALMRFQFIGGGLDFHPHLFPTPDGGIQAKLRSNYICRKQGGNR